MHRLICNQKNVNFSIDDAHNKYNIKQQPSSPLTSTNHCSSSIDGVAVRYCSTFAYRRQRLLFMIIEMISPIKIDTQYGKHRRQ